MGKPSSGFPTRSDTNQAVQLQKMARCLKFRIKEVEGLHYLCSENKGADQLSGYRCVVFTTLIVASTIPHLSKSKISSL